MSNIILVKIVLPRDNINNNVYIPIFMTYQQKLNRHIIIYNGLLPSLGYDL